MSMASALLVTRAPMLIAALVGMVGVVLPEPLTLFKDHEGLTLEGCRDGAVIAAKSGSETKFVQGLVLLGGLRDFTLRQLEFELLPMHV